MSRPTKKDALTRDLGIVLASLDQAAVDSIPVLVKRIKEAIADPNTKIETSYQLLKFFVSHAENAHNERLEAKEKEDTATKKADEEPEADIEYFSVDLPDDYVETNQPNKH